MIHSHLQFLLCRLQFAKKMTNPMGSVRSVKHNIHKDCQNTDMRRPHMQPEKIRGLTFFKSAVTRIFEPVHASTSTNQLYLNGTSFELSMCSFFSLYWYLILHQRRNLPHYNFLLLQITTRTVDMLRSTIQTINRTNDLILTSRAYLKNFQVLKWYWHKIKRQINEQSTYYN